MPRKGILILFVGSFMGIYSQREKEENPSIQSIPIQAGLVRDERFSVKNYSFGRRFSPKGNGEYLEVYFDVINNTDEELQFKMFVFAFYEISKAKDSSYRKFVPYPRWRKRDFEEEAK